MEQQGINPPFLIIWLFKEREEPPIYPDGEAVQPLYGFGGIVRRLYFGGFGVVKP